MAVISKQTLPQRFMEIKDIYSSLPALMSKDENQNFVTKTFSELWDIVENFAAGLAEIGIKRGDHAGIISDNREEWMITDLGLLSLGVIDVPRGSDSTDQEIAYILEHSDSKVAFAENKAQFEKILKHIKKMKNLKIIILYDEKESVKAPAGIKIFSFNEIMEKGSKKLGGKKGFLEEAVKKGNGDDLATLIYTSGTTGEPKGVMLTHMAFLFQVDRIKELLRIKAGQIMLSVLPIWHSFERAVEYLLLFNGLSIAYSKPIGAILIEDMAKVKPQWLASVPRIWEGVRAGVYKKLQKEKAIKLKMFNFFIATSTAFFKCKDLFLGRVPRFKPRFLPFDMLISIIPLILLSPLKLLANALAFNKIKAKLGGKFIAGISGGGALPPYVDNFFKAVGVLLIEGYGLTETGPILNVRSQSKPVPGTVGSFLSDIEYKIIDKEGNQVGPGKKGILWVRSVQVMLGYYKRPEATKKVMDGRWLNTGDICMLTRNKELKIIGREKETIVLLGGENIEPVPIEEKVKESSLIENVVIVGQDKKFLAALIIPDFDELRNLAAHEGIAYKEMNDLVSDMQIRQLFHSTIQGLINTKTGFKPFEQIFRITILPEPFEQGKELTNSLKVKRNFVFDLYKKEIDQLFK